jgi:nucleoside 2-deoxyribosyltransferase
MTKAIKCFIAMALGKKDTRALYRNSIKPVLLKLRIEPRCMTFIEHNDELNYRIIQEINEADIVIADLTYARPSVYYEAGYAERVAPVIYSCRKDHFPKGGKVLDENQAVHFDLQMKNIIGWSNPKDHSFQRGLFKRLEIIKAPIIEAKQHSERENREAEAFEAKSVYDRLNVLSGISIPFLKRLHYIEIPTRYVISWFGKKISRKSISFLATRFADRLTVTMLRQILEVYRHQLHSLLSDNVETLSRRKIVRVDDTMIFCTLNKLPMSRVRQVLPSAERGSSDNELVIRGFERITVGKSKLNINRVTRFFIIDDIKTAKSFSTRIMSLKLSKTIG